MDHRRWPSDLDQAGFAYRFGVVGAEMTGEPACAEGALCVENDRIIFHARPLVRRALKKPSPGHRMELPHFNQAQRRENTPYLIEQSENGHDVLLSCPHCGALMLDASPHLIKLTDSIPCPTCRKRVGLAPFFRESETIVCRSCGLVQSETRADCSGADSTLCERCRRKIILRPSLSLAESLSSYGVRIVSRRKR